jgi:hypothetical protein
VFCASRQPLPQRPIKIAGAQSLLSSRPPRSIILPNTARITVVDDNRRLHNLAPFIRPICLTLATSSDSMVCKINPWLSKNESRFYRDKQGIKGLAAPFPCTPNPHRNSSASRRTISLDDPEHLLQNHHVSVASLRLLFTFAPERRSASVRNRCSPSPEYPVRLPHPALDCKQMRKVATSRTCTCAQRLWLPWYAACIRLSMPESDSCRNPPFLRGGRTLNFSYLRCGICLALPSFEPAWLVGQGAQFRLYQRLQ